jgi:hypothetical protein
MTRNTGNFFSIKPVATGAEMCRSSGLKILNKTYRIDNQHVVKTPSGNGESHLAFFTAICTLQERALPGATCENPSKTNLPFYPLGSCYTHY